MIFCLSSDHLLDRTIFRDANDTSGHAAKENLSQPGKCLNFPKKQAFPRT
jgi:hypothetical protein